MKNEEYTSLLQEKTFLGIDPSTKATGYGIVNEGGELLDYGVIRPEEEMNFGELILYKYNILKELIERYNVTLVACEDQFNGVNPDTFKKLSRVTGLVQLLAAQQEKPLELYYPAAWRKIFHNTGKAKKPETLKLVNQMHGLKLLVKQNDISDAIGIAHAARKKFTDTNK